MARKRSAKSLPFLMLEAMTSAAEIGQASAVTLGHRMPMLAAMGWWPSAELTLEMHRMVTEKMSAAMEGGIAASRETTKLALRAASGKARPDDFAAGLVTIALAATHPARISVKANARRLSAR